MNNEEIDQILEKAKQFFKIYIAESHAKNTLKLSKLKNFNINPFTFKYLANFFSGNESPESIAKALILPRVLGTSFTTSFGTNIQNRFCAEVLDGFGSAVDGIDIEFIDYLDKRRKFCQLKAGPDTINSGDVDPIKNKFKSLYQRARTNNLEVFPSDLIIGITYGKVSQLNAHYKAIALEFNIHIGKDFWHRLTGSEDFYFRLIDTFGVVACDIDGTKILNTAITSLAKEIESHLNDSYWK